MKKSLLFAAVLALAVTANAQVARSHAGGKTVKAIAAQQMKNAKIDHRVADRNIGMNGTSVRPQNAVPGRSAYYVRPKGTMYVNWDKEGSGFIMPFVNTKPYDEVTWRNFSTAGGSPSWGYWLYTDGGRDSLTSSERDLTVTYGYEYEDCPYLMMGKIGPYTLSGYRVNDALAVEAEANSGVASVINSREIYEGQETNFLGSAHYYGSSNRFGTERYGWTYYSGAPGPDYDPDAPEEEQDRSGYWFGKNYGGYNVFGCGFEKPVSPYVLNNVYFWAVDVVVTADTDLECRIYRLSDLPQYGDTTNAEIDAELLTEDALIATGRTTITTDMNEDGQPILEFTLYETDPDLGIEYETTPMIDDAIVILILGMDQETITSMSGLITSDEEDEQVGELTFIGHQEDGVITDVYGLNNFFSGPLTLKSGSSIMIDVTRPFMVYNYSFETGEYTFPNEGGQLVYDFDTEQIEGIQIYADAPKSDYTVTTVDGGEVPDWLTIELEDLMITEGEYAGEFSGVVNAHVTAAALPVGMSGREAMVRFAINGAYLDYHFIQGDINGVTWPDDTYILGEVNENGWDPSVGVQMAQDGNTYTADVTFDGRNDGFNYFSFTTLLAETSGDWDAIKDYRFGAVSDGDFWVTEEQLNKELDLQAGETAFKIAAGEYTLTVDRENMTLVIAPKAAQGLLGDFDNSGIIDVEDVNAAINIILKIKSMSDYPGNGDMDGNGYIDVEDVNAIINIILKLV
ncbi:MAG: dockerin type I repeat-containing protein [Muribaculaceae bacterium]|nr:dockerin type I repeat-containing protein [Muribaculaceae bacterium]